MIKVLLVEDEILVRVGIKSIVDWEEHGYTVIGEASNGAEALEKIQDNVPDLVMTDLVMGTMNGFELIKVLRQDYPAIRIIVLSCHNDFQNVKEAMRLGASDYLFKLTIMPDELIRTLDMVSNQMGIVKLAVSSATDQIIHQNLSTIKSKVIHAAIEKSYVSAVECNKELKQLGVKVDLELDYILVYISADEFYLANVNSRIKERELLKFSMLNFIAEAFERIESSEVFEYDGGDCLVIINTEGVEHEAILETFSMLREYMQRYLGISVSGGISLNHRGIRDLQQAYQEAITALEVRFYSGGGSIYDYREGLDILTDGGIDLPENLNCGLLDNWLEQIAIDKVKTFLTEYFDFMESCQRVSRHRVRNRLLEVLVPFLTAARKRGVDLEEMRYEGGFTPQQVISKYESLKLIRTWFMQFADDFMEECRKKGQSRGRAEIIKVKDYVRNHLSSSAIGVSTAAVLVNMSESYFSHLFKKETGSSFVDYVNSMRIEKAKELLLQTDMKIFEIASRVGVENTNYFSMLFKKLTGTSPSEFRQ